MTHMNRTTKCFPTGWNTAKPCDICDSAVALIFCRTDVAFMCMACDANVHTTCVKHARVWMCEVCKQAPATVTCKADAAALCLACDRDIHSANPLARRHIRVAVVPFYDTADSVVMKSTAAGVLEATSANMFPAPQGNIDPKLETCVAYHDYVLDPWTFPDATVPSKFLVDNPELKSMEFLFSDPNQFLEFDSYGIPSQPYSDSVVPVQTTTKMPQPGQFPHDYSSETRYEIDFTRTSISSYTSSYTTPSLSVSSSSIDVGVVPDSCALSEISYPFGKNSILNVGLSWSRSSSQAVGMDREARVLRYKEKRKNRKFEKTVRYASRKAYAETRPRFKGRFVKRTDTESDIEIIFGAGSANYDIAETRYGIVPSFIMEDLEE